jgi:Fanconi anemia group M protein
MLCTKNYRDTASLLEIIARRLETPRNAFSLIKKRKPATLREQQELIVETLPGIGPTIAKSLLKKFKSIKTLANADEKELQDVEKIGKKKAQEIKKVIESEYSL